MESGDLHAAVEEQLRRKKTVLEDRKMRYHDQGDDDTDEASRDGEAQLDYVGVVGGRTVRWKQRRANF